MTKPNQTAAVTRQTILERATPLFLRIEELQDVLHSMSCETNQGRRAVRAEACSVANATAGVLYAVFDAIGYTLPVNIPFGGRQPARSTRATVTDDEVRAANALLGDVAEYGHEAANERCRLYESACRSAEQLAEPDVTGEQFARTLQHAKECHTALTASHAEVVEKLGRLKTTQGDRLEAANVFAAALAGLVKGHGEDVESGLGLPVHVNLEQGLADDRSMAALVAAGQPEANEFAADFLRMLGNDGLEAFVNMELDVASPGSRMGFLRSADTEREMAYRSLFLLGLELERLEPKE